MGKIPAGLDKWMKAHKKGPYASKSKGAEGSKDRTSEKKLGAKAENRAENKKETRKKVKK